MDIALTVTPQLTKQDFHALVAKHAQELRALGVLKLGLFGSTVRGEQNAASDVDVLVQFEPDAKSFDTFMRLVLLLENLFGRPVELVTTEALSPYIGPSILAEVEYVALAA